MYLEETSSAPCAGIPICRFVCPCMLERVFVQVGIRKTRVRKQGDAQTRACLSVVVLVSLSTITLTQRTPGFGSPNMIRGARLRCPRARV